MWAKFLHFEFIVIYLLTLVPWPHPHVIKLFCSKDNTRLVRKLIQSKLMPIFDKYQVKLPLECPLHPLRDIFAPQQDAKNRNRPTQWICRLCGKSFFEEKFVDNHFENRHKDIINKAEDAVCFASLCDIMRCDVFASKDSSLVVEDSYAVTDMEVWDSTGQSLSLAQASPSYITLTSQRKPNYILPSLSISSKKQEQIDEARKAQSLLKDEPVSKDNEAKFVKATSLPPLEENQGNYSEEKKKFDDQSNNMHKFRADCKPEDIVKLKIKCELLIRTCITGLLLQMSDYAFKEMEEELNKAICWYLSCDRYWEDGPLEPKAFPWGLILVLVMVLSLGICFCYYIIWILFDSEETISSISSAGHHSPRYTQKGVLDRRKDVSRGSILPISDRDPDLRVSSYTDDLLRPESNELSHSEHYIYVTYPPDLKRRLLEKYE